MRIWKNKKGIAMETAIWFMLVIAALCTFITNLALLGVYQTQIEKQDLQRRLELDQIGEDYIATLKAGEEFSGEDGDYQYEDYAYSVESDDASGIETLKVWRKTDRNKRTLVLYVEAKVETVAENRTVDILSWRYTFPDDT